MPNVVAPHAAQEDKPSRAVGSGRGDPPQTPGARRLLFVALVAACVGTAVAAIALGGGDARPPASASASAAKMLSSARIEARPVVVFRRLGAAQPAGGQIAIGDLGRPTRRAAAAMRCDRVHFAAGRGLCVERGGGFAAGYRATIFGSDLRERGGLDLAGIPSRARVSPDGRYGSVTQFVTGHSYTESGGFSTQTTLIDLAGATKIADLEDFAVLRGERFVTADDVNFWGVTFERDSDRFYATLATGGRTYLVRGSVAAKRMRVIRDNVECPSLSPDGTRLAYKKRVGPGSDPWRLTILELTTMREAPLAETRSVDDQVEWLDDGAVLYGLDGAVWTTRADGTGPPRRFLTSASSPAVVRW